MAYPLSVSLLIHGLSYLIVEAWKRRVAFLVVG